MSEQAEISVIKRSASWRNPDSAIAESSTIIRNAAAGPTRPSMSARQAKLSNRSTVTEHYVTRGRN